MIVEAVLANFRRWRTSEPLLSEPEVVTQLPWGTAHTALKLVSSDANGPVTFVLRYLPRIEATLALDFSQEIALMELAAARGLAPKVNYVQAQNRLLVTEFIEGSTDVSALELGDLMHHIHQLPVRGPAVDLAAQLASYTDVALARAVATRELIDPHFPPLERAIARLKDVKPVLCHNDLGKGNVIANNGRLVAIDWEYAAPGSPYFDAAAACAGWPEINESELLKRVFPRNFEPYQWQLARAVYAAIEWNWYKASGVTAPRHLSQARVSELVSALP